MQFAYNCRQPSYQDQAAQRRMSRGMHQQINNLRSLESKTRRRMYGPKLNVNTRDFPQQPLSMAWSCATLLGSHYLLSVTLVQVSFCFLTRLFWQGTLSVRRRRECAKEANTMNVQGCYSRSGDVGISEPRETRPNSRSRSYKECCGSAWHPHRRLGEGLH